MKKVFLNELIENLDLTKAEKWYKMEKEKIMAAFKRKEFWKKIKFSLFNKH